MDNGTFNFILRVLMLQLLAAGSQIAFTKRYYALGLFTFGLWITIFRLAFLRAIALYVGVFGKATEIENGTTRLMLDFLSSSQAANFTDIFVAIGVVAVFLYILKLKEGVKI